MQDFDFAIIGAGIAGVSAAYHLVPHARVIVLEREQVAAYHTTGRSAALHSETYGSAEIRAINDQFFGVLDGASFAALSTAAAALVKGSARAVHYVNAVESEAPAERTAAG